MALCYRRIVAPEFGRQGITSALLDQWLTFDAVLDVDASITAKPFFEYHGFQVVRQQNVEARGEWFINYRLRYEGKR